MSHWKTEYLSKIKGLTSIRNTYGDEENRSRKQVFH